MRRLPKFSYESWLVVFLFSNLVFNVIAMLEFAAVAYAEQTQAEAKAEAKPGPKKSDGGPAAMFELPSNEEEEDDDDPTCECFKKLFGNNDSKPRVGAYTKVCSYFYVCVKPYFIASPKVIDKLFRLFFLSGYLLVLFVLFLIPLGNQY